jgi:DNA (cytosine-5)-methyltransferase 1
MPIRKNKNKPTAIDLYSGIGGWSLGFEIAGIAITDSYEWWEPANNTHQSNLGVNAHQVDIRELSLSDLPKKIDFVIGSPPCTQFSYSNRGGSGDVADGLQDIKKFLSVVQHTKPKFWAMENVPRVASILKKELSDGGELEDYADVINPSMVYVYDFSEFGLPQRRKRCIAGNFNSELLESYKSKLKKRTLGDVITALSKSKIHDPNYLLARTNNSISELEREEPLNWEELRYNREAKTHHTIYNNMEFPDPIEKSVRTVTATCTRVSRESIVIADDDNCRRLSVRERGCLQGFPITYEFLGRSYSAKLKMIGNAIPPVFTYYLANAMLEITSEKLVPLDQVAFEFPVPTLLAELTKPDKAGRTYPQKRSFRFAIHNLRFKSGTRFELTNSKGEGSWSTSFYFGDSKRILSLQLDKALHNRIEKYLRETNSKFVEKLVRKVERRLPIIDQKELQSVWTKQVKGKHPFHVLDELGAIASDMIEMSKLVPDEVFQKIVKSEATVIDSMTKLPIATRKLQRFAREIVCGMILACRFNTKNRT